MEFVNGMTSHIIENNPVMCQKPPTRFGIPLLTSEKFHCDYHGNHQPVKNSTVTKPWKFHPPRFPPSVFGSPHLAARLGAESCPRTSCEATKASRSWDRARDKVPSCGLVFHQQKHGKKHQKWWFNVV